MYRQFFNFVKNKIPRISDTELIALRSGDVSIDRQILQGKVTLPKKPVYKEKFPSAKLEELLNVKFVILSSYYYEAKELHKVVQCPEKKDREIKPEYYVIVEHTGNHYKLVTFDKTKLFTFETIPESLKKHIVETCMSGAPGSFHEIEQFRKYADSI